MELQVDPSEWSHQLLYAMDEVGRGRELSNISASTICFSFVLKFCDRGRGLKPDWANKGMEFLHFSSHPDFTKYITDQEFEVRIPNRNSQLWINFSISQELKNLTGKCHSHVMGDSSGTPERRQSVSPHIESEDWNFKFYC